VSAQSFALQNVAGPQDNSGPRFGQCPPPRRGPFSARLSEELAETKWVMPLVCGAHFVLLFADKNLCLRASRLNRRNKCGTARRSEAFGDQFDDVG